MKCIGQFAYERFIEELKRRGGDSPGEDWASLPMSVRHGWQSFALDVVAFAKQVQK